MKLRFSALGQFWFILKFSGRFLWDTSPSLFLVSIFFNSINSLVIIPNLLIDKAFLDTLVGNIGRPLSQEVVRLVIMLVAARLGLQLIRTAGRHLSGYYNRSLFWHLYQRAEVVISRKYASIAVPTLEDPQFKDRYNKIEREGLNKLQSIAANYTRLPQHVAGIVSSLSIFAISQPWVIVASLASLVPTVLVERWYIRRDYELDTSVALLHRKRGIYYWSLGRARSYLELRILGIHKYLSGRVAALWDEITGKRLALYARRRGFGFGAGIVDDAVSYSFDAVFGIQALLGRITIGTAQAYIRAISEFKRSVGDLTTAVMEMYENYLYLKDLVWFLELENPYFNDSGIKLDKPISQGIRFDHVSFKYPGTSKWILKDVSFEITPRQNIALIGKNGAGKTTLVKLLCGFYTPDKGLVTVDGIPVDNLNKPVYWKKIATLFQEYDAYGLTVKEVIGLGDVDNIADLPKIKRMAAATGIDKWIESLPEKYDNSVTRDFAKGVTPSTGQWQRLALSRTLFRDPEVMILDEPTSNVDPEAEEQIFKQILSLGRDKIILFISHRFSTVRQADRILVLDDGKITEEGSHEQLMKMKGTYSRLFTLQARSYR